MSQHVEIPGYDILERIGEGGMALVYKARQRSLNRVVAVKVMRPELVTDASALAQFRLEANSVATLKHPNILMIHEAGHSGSQPYFIMEYVSAYSVYAWVTRKGILSAGDALTVADSVAKALKYAWEKAGMVHGDLKPGNILVDEDGVVKVTDFSGLSKNNLSTEAALIKNLTIGTPYFMAPEQAGGFSELDFRSDIYSLGAVLYQLLTGVMPFTQCGDQEAMRMHMEGYLEDPLKLNPALTPAAAMLMEKMMVKDRDHRYGSWDMVIEDIHRVLSGKPPAPPLPFPGSSTIPRASIATPKPAIRVPGQVFAPYHPSTPSLQRTKPRDSSSRIHLAIVLIVALAAFNAVLFYLWKTRGPGALKPQAPVEPPPAVEVAPFPPPPVERPPAPAPVTPPRPQAPVAPSTPSAPPPREDVAPPKPPPAVEPPVVPAPESVAQDEPTLDALREHFKTVGILSQYCRNLDFEKARAAAESRASSQPEGGPWKARAQADLERMAYLSQLWKDLASSGTGAAGLVLAGDRTSDKIASIREGTVTILRVFGGESTATATVTKPFRELALNDHLAIIERVRKSDVVQSQGAWAYAVSGRVPASAQSIPMIKAWVEDWTRSQQNALADQEVENLKRIVQENRFSEAIEAGRTIQTARAGTDIVQWARADELKNMIDLAKDEIRAATASFLAPEDKPDASQPAAPAVDTPPSDKSHGPDTDAAIQVDCRQIENRWAELDGQLIRLSYMSRSPITREGPGKWTATLRGPGPDVRVYFNDDGQRYLQRAVAESSSDNRTRYVYGRVDGARRLVQLEGRTRKTLMGNKGYEYNW